MTYWAQHQTLVEKRPKCEATGRNYYVYGATLDKRPRSPDDEGRVICPSCGKSVKLKRDFYYTRTRIPYHLKPNE